MKRKNIFFLCLLFLMVFFLTKPTMAETSVPDALLGIWSAPDCAKSEDVMLMSPHYLMHYRFNMHKTLLLENLRSEDNDGETLYHFQAVNGGTYLMKATNDGLLQSTESSVHPEQPLYTAWNSTTDIIAQEYSRCIKLFEQHKNLKQAEVNALFSLDRIYTACSPSGNAAMTSSEACRQAAFTEVDTNKDGALSSAEMMDLYRLTAFLALSINNCGDQTSYPDLVTEEGKEFAALMMDTMDEDQSGSLDIEELYKGFSDPVNIKGRIYVFTDIARNLRDILPAVPEPDRMKSCVVTDRYGNRGNLRELGIELTRKVPPADAAAASGCAGCAPPNGSTAQTKNQEPRIRFNRPVRPE